MKGTRSEPGQYSEMKERSRGSGEYRKHVVRRHAADLELLLYKKRLIADRLENKKLNERYANRLRTGNTRRKKTHFVMYSGLINKKASLIYSNEAINECGLAAAVRHREQKLG